MILLENGGIMFLKISLLFLLINFKLISSESFLSESVSKLAAHNGGAIGYAFENDIRDFLEKIRDILKNGDPDNDVPPMEPLPLEFFDFDFILRDSRLRGYLDSMLVHNVSDFIVTNVQFNVIGFKLELGLAWENLTIDGKYQAHGNIFENIVSGEGNFKSQTAGLDLNVMIQIGSNFNRSLIKDLTLDFTFVEDHINYTNELEDGSNQEFGNEYLQSLLYRIRDEYFPLLLNTLTLVGSDLIHDLTLDEILKIILDIIQGNGLELIRSEPKAHPLIFK